MTGAPRMAEDTIAAVATPLGEGGLAVIRLSGPDALGVADRCFVPAGRRSLRPLTAPSHTLHLGRIEHDGRLVDEVLLAVMRAPRTYTREDVVEISCHGGLLPAKLVLTAVLASGARLAEPGEFTRRAFVNGRLDLAQAEAVADIIHARTELALTAAEEQLAGKLSQRIRLLREDLLGVLAHLEAHLDFPEEDLAPDTAARLLGRLRDGRTFLETLLRTAPEGQILRRGVRAAIVGRPNVGKSSLLNQLLGRDRAIVSPEPGTTRDTIEETANIRGIPVVFVDTAGLREADDRVEQEGVRRTHTAVRQAELVIHVLDASEPLQPEDEQHLATLAGRKRLVVLNKSDRPNRLDRAPEAVAAGLPISCLTGAGIEPLKDAIQRAVWAGELRADMVEVMINARHQEALRLAREALQGALDGLESGATFELVALDLRRAIDAVGEVTGQTTTEDLLDRIFGEFCIGK